MKFSELREKYKRFYYNGFDYRINENGLFVEFDYSVDDTFRYHPFLIVWDVSDLSKFNKMELENFIFNLGMIEIPSYWKATCTREIVVKAGNLDSKQIVFWEDLFIQGMSEYFFTNKIDFTKSDFLKIITTSDKSFKKNHSEVNNKYLLAVSGGKDSLTTRNIFLNEKIDFAEFSLNTKPASSKILREDEAIGKVYVTRYLDTLLLEQNNKGFLNGHIPFSAYLAFLSVFCAYLFDYSDVVFSNERSSDEGNIKYLNNNINHQYSKSLDFEIKFRNYIQGHLTNINYFSFLRPLYDLQIAKIFSQVSETDFSKFISCNVGQREGYWCGNCAKCLSTFILLYPFVSDEIIVEIFSKNLFTDRNLVDLLDNLVGNSKPKPFECVGTYEEIKIGLYLAIHKHKTNKLPIILEHAEKILAHESELETRTQVLLESWNQDNFLSEKFAAILKKYIHE